MDEPTQTVLLLAGRLGEPDDPGSIVSLLERLARLNVAAQVLCLARGGEVDYRLIERPQLGHRWKRLIAARRLCFDEGLRRPGLLHVIHPTMGSLALAIADHWKIPYVLTVDEFLPPAGRLKVSRRWCRGLIATSRELADDLVRTRAVPGGFLTVIPPGIAIPDESSATICRGTVPVIGTAGRLVASAGIVEFLNAARRVLDAGVDAEFLIAGQGDAEVDLRRRAARLRIGERITFAEQNVVGLRFWRVLDVYCQTALTPTVGRTLALAMAFGVPSIASDLDGLRTLVRHGETGLRVPPGDSGALSRTILSLLDDPARTRALGQAGRESIRRDFDPAVEAQTLAALYRRVLTDSSSGAARQFVA
jgi:glycosyltransferase involved in cell wall biosynthesis